jgi:cytochrome c oxidase subunit II
MDDTSVSPPTPPSPSPVTSGSPINHILRAVIIWIACSVVTLVVFILIAPNLSGWGILPPFASDRSSEIYSVMFLFTVLSIPVFFMVVVFGGYSAFTFTRGRRRDGVTFTPSRNLPVIWVIISVILVTFLYVYGLSFLNKVNAQAGSDALTVNVTGEQWLWNYSYPQYGLAESSVLELPVDRPVIFNIQSIDVQHSFWVPAFGIKQDAVPGEMISVSATPNKIGTYVVRCAELCGLYHAYMETPVYVVSASDFQTWVNQQPTQVPTPSSSSLIHPNALPVEAMTRNGGSSANMAEG